jgi:hypothetical protein
MTSPANHPRLRPLQRIALGMVGVWVFGILIAPTFHAAGHARGAAHTHDALGVTQRTAAHCHGAACHDHPDANQGERTTPAIDARPAAPHHLGHAPAATLVPAPALPPLVPAPPIELVAARRTDDAPPRGCASTVLPRGPPSHRSA